jgi:hypothetical protein
LGKIICKVVEFCVGHENVIPNMEETYILRGGRARRQPDHFTTDHYFRVEVFLATLDTQLTELNLRFNGNVMDLHLFKLLGYANLLRNTTEQISTNKKELD